MKNETLFVALPPLIKVPVQTTKSLHQEMGECIAKIPAQAFPQILTLARNGSAIAQYVLSMMYYSGSAVSQDSIMAEQWLEKSAAQGFAKAQYHLAMQILEESPTRALALLEAAATQHNADEQFAL